MKEKQQEKINRKRKTAIESKHIKGSKWIIREWAKANRSEKIDGKSRLLRIVLRQQLCIVLLHVWILQALIQLVPQKLR
jgi:hypothetical protein